MKSHWYAGALLLLGITTSAAQVASHTPRATAGLERAVARVNEVVLTERDLLREMYAMFPYARQHGGGFPKGMEADIRKGALDMIVFEELAYQEALRNKVVVPAERMTRAEAAFRKQFPSPEKYQEYLKFECHGSTRVLRQRIRRSLLIEAMVKTEVARKSVVSLAQAKAYYDQNPQHFQRAETFSIQTISIIPPATAGADVQKEAQKRAEDAFGKAKATKTYRDFGLLAEKVSDDDWHVNMGDRKSVEASKLPPPLLEAARKMKSGDVSDLLQLGPNYTLFRLNAHTPAGKVKFDEVKAQVQSDLQKAKTEQLRSAFNQRLRKSAKIELL
jgi:hypothetical protein